MKMGTCILPVSWIWIFNGKDFLRSVLYCHQKKKKKETRACGSLTEYVLRAEGL